MNNFIGIFMFFYEYFMFIIQEVFKKKKPNLRVSWIIWHKFVYTNRTVWVYFPSENWIKIGVHFIVGYSLVTCLYRLFYVRMIQLTFNWNSIRCFVQICSVWMQPSLQIGIFTRKSRNCKEYWKKIVQLLTTLPHRKHPIAVVVTFLNFSANQ